MGGFQKKTICRDLFFFDPKNLFSWSVLKPAVLSSRKGLPAGPSDERGHRDVGEVAPERHPHCEQLGDLQSHRTQPVAQLRVRRQALNSDEPQQQTFNRFPCVSRRRLKASNAFSAPPLTVLLCSVVCVCTHRVVGLCVCNFQGDLSGEVESGQRYSAKRRLQKRPGPADSGETDRKPGKEGQKKRDE